MLGAVTHTVNFQHRNDGAAAAITAVEQFDNCLIRDSTLLSRDATNVPDA